MKKLFLFFLVVGIACKHKPASSDFESGLKSSAEHAGSDKDKMTSLSKLAWYYMDINRKRSDSVMSVIYSMAESSKDKSLLILAYLFDAQRHMLLDEYKTEVQAVRTLADKAYDLASSENDPESIAYSYLYMAHSKRMMGEMDAAKDFLSRAYNLVANSESDSLKIEFYYLRSQVLQGKRELNMALDDALQVQQVAERSRNNRLRMMAYTRLGSMYRDIDSVKAKDNYKLSAETAKKLNDHEQLISANINLGRLFSQQNELKQEGLRYLNEAMGLARQINHRSLIAQSHLAFIRYYLKTGQPDTTIQYIKTHFPELNRYYAGNGLGARFYYNYGYFNYILGKYYYDNKTDKDAGSSFLAALNYFRKSDSAYASNIVSGAKANLNFYYGASNYYLYFLNKNLVSSTGGYWYSSYSDSLRRQQVSNYYTNATYYFYNTQNLARVMNDPEFMRNVFTWMEDLYLDSASYYDRIRRGNQYTSYVPRFDYYQLAYYSRLVHDSCNRAFMALTNEKENIRIERMHESNMQAIRDLQKRQQENIKQIGIMVGLAFLFVLLILLGFLKVSEFSIRALGFFAFLFLFEFLLLIIDKYIHELTHGEVISLLVIKVAIAAVLVPIHHFLEKKVIHSLTTRKLLRAGSTI